MIKKNTFHITSLGCAKNTVDSESISLILNHAGFLRLDEPENAEIMIINTCGFIQAARDESLHILDNITTHKEKGQIVIAAGCLTERFKDHIPFAISNLDALFGTRRWMDILTVVDAARNRRNKSIPYAHFPTAVEINQDPAGIPRIAIQGSSAYLKIADGCRHRCAFCAIPLIKGSKHSRTIDQIVNDAEFLETQGVKEINFIAQDSTDYGFDLGLKDGLAQLLEILTVRIPNIPWFRILYAYPGNVTPRLIELMATEPQILPYLDIPLQHSHPEILRQMLRPSNLDKTFEMIEQFKKKIPNIALRSTFIVGFPGETEKEFEHLLDFIQQIEFDHVGAFTYSLEEGTPAEPLGDPVPPELKMERLERLMLLQEEISSKRSALMLGKTIPVLIEGSSEGISVGRSYRDAPEIDGLVFIDSELSVGEIYQIKITGSMVHDLLGSITK